MTAVEWLVKEMIMQMGIRIENTEVGIKLIEEAKIMEKQQIINAGGHGDLYGTSKDYYNYLESKK